MKTTHMLTRPRDVQAWVTDRRGRPAVSRVTDPSSGAIRPRLALRFEPGRTRPHSVSVDDGVMPVSWAAWLAEFERQGLALEVGDKTDYALVERPRPQ